MGEDVAQIKSIITKINEVNKSESDMQYIRAETIEGNEIIFWGSSKSSVNLKALEKQKLPLLITCDVREKETECTHLFGDYFSVSEESVVTVYPYQPHRIESF